MRAVGVRLVRRRTQYCPALLFALAMSGLSSFLMMLMAVTPFGNVITGIAPGTPAGELLTRALMSLSLLPVLKAVDRLHEGLLLQQKKTVWVSASGLLDLFTQLVVLAAMLGTDTIADMTETGETNPLLAPIIALYVGMVCKMILIGLGVCCVHGGSNNNSGSTSKYDRGHLQDQDQDQNQGEEEEEEDDVHLRTPPVRRTTGCCSFVKQILRLWWPLAWVKTFQGICRPLMNLLVATSAASAADGIVGVAVLTLCFPLGHLFYGGLNNLKGIAAAFMDVRDSLPYVKRFIPSVVMLSFAFGCIFLWSPLDSGIGALALMSSFGADLNLIEHCIVPLRIFSFFCFAVGTRNYFTALAVLYKKTGPLAYSGPVRVTVLVIMGWGVLSAGLKLTGGTLGIAALFSGFVAEATTVVICTQCCCSRSRSSNKQDERSRHEIVALDDEEEEIFSAAVGLAIITEDSHVELSTKNKSSIEYDHHLYEKVHTIFEVSYPWTERLLNGKKTIETRTYALPNKYLHRTLALYETHTKSNTSSGGGMRDRCVGLIEFGSCKEYLTKEEWSNDSAQHCVAPDAAADKFGWIDGIPRYGWKVAYVQRTKRHPLPMRFERDVRSFFDVQQW